MRIRFQPDHISILLIIGFFILFFWPATMAGRFFVGGDSLLYSYPMRTVAWEMIRNGQLPLWTPTLLSGFPLLSMSQLALAYPLTWGYLFLSGHAAEQIYVLAPFLLAPIFTYFYARQIGRSALASLLAGLTYGYGGLMASQIATYGILTNAVMWLPLVLVAIERARTKPFIPSLLWMTLAYSMSVLTGLGQGVLYVGIIAVAYAGLLSLKIFVDVRTETSANQSADGNVRVPTDARTETSANQSADENVRVPTDVRTETSANQSADGNVRVPTDVRTETSANQSADGNVRVPAFAPLIVCLCGMVLAACLAAFQILETAQSQRQSIRSRLTYEMFSGGAFTFAGVWQSFLLPFYHFLEEETFVAGLAALMAVAAITASFKRGNREWRLLFWLAMAAASFVLMLGDNSPVYRLLYHVPLLNLFRVPARHAFEWTFALAIVAAYGWDRIAALIQSRKSDSLLSVLVGVALLIASALVGYGWWKATGKLPDVSSTAPHTGLSEQGWLLWKLAFTVSIGICVVWGLRMAQGKWRTVMLSIAIAIACFVEPYILLQRWWFHFAKPADYFTTVSAPTRFLQQYKPEENRIYTSVAPNYIFDLPRTEPHNITARREFHNAAGYEPLMSARYSKAFGNGVNFLTPGFSAPPDRQILSPNWQVVDLLNVRFLVEFSPPASGYVVREDARFAADTSIELKPGMKTTLGGISAMDTLTMVSLLANSSDLNDGEIVAEIKLTTSDGRVINRELQAGRDTAEWAHERADVKAAIRHRLARIFDTRPGEGFPIHRYWTRFDLGEKLDIDRVEITNISRDASVIISNVSAYDSTKEEAHQLAQRLADHWSKVYDFDNVQIYENSRVLPRVWLVPEAEVVSEEEALQRIRGDNQQTFNPREVTLLEKPPDEKLFAPQGKFVGEAKARIVSYEASRLTIETEASKEAVLVVSEANYPGWEATIDDQPAEIYTANYLLRGVIVPEGKHQVVMTYRSKPARIGALISVLALALIAGLAIKTIGGKK